MSRVWKYPLGLTEAQAIIMPKGAKILTLAMQGEQPTLWVLVDPNASITNRNFWTFGTGQDIQVSVWLEYVGTWQSGGFVWHVFDGGEDD